MILTHFAGACVKKNATYGRQTRLRRVEMALARIESGDFGYCAQCDEDTEVKRLEADPTVPLCIKCAQSG